MEQDRTLTVGAAPFINGCSNLQLQVGAAPFIKGATLQLEPNKDTNDNDIDEIVKFNKDKARKIYGKDRNEQRDIEKTDEDINDDT